MAGSSVVVGRATRGPYPNGSPAQPDPARRDPGCTRGSHAGRRYAERVTADPKDRWHDLGSFIREQRGSARLSLRRLSELAGISNPYLSQIERATPALRRDTPADREGAAH